MSSTDQAISSVIPRATDDQDGRGAPGQGRGGICLKAESKGIQRGLWAVTDQAWPGRPSPHFVVPRPGELVQWLAPKVESCATDLGNGCGTAQTGQLHKLVHAELVLIKQLLVHGLGLLLAEETHGLSPHPSGAPSRGRLCRPRSRPLGFHPSPTPRLPAQNLAYLRYFTAELAMTSESPRPPEISRCGTHQVAPARQEPAWTLTRDRREPATSSPSPRSARKPDIQLARREPSDPPGACAALSPAPEGPGPHSPLPEAVLGLATPPLLLVLPCAPTPGCLPTPAPPPSGRPVLRSGSLPIAEAFSYCLTNDPKCFALKRPSIIIRHFFMFWCSSSVTAKLYSTAVNPGSCPTTY